MTREAHFQSDMARQQQRVDFAQALDWAGQFPLSDLRKRGLITRRSQGPELVEELLGFLGIAHPSQWKETQVVYRKSQKFESDPFALSAWLREGELEALGIKCAPYDEERFLDVLRDVRSWTRNGPERWWPALQEPCAAAGVAVVIVEPYSGARANGAAHWLSSDKALIQLSLRHRWEDIFWFSFFHEAGHIVLHRKKDRFGDRAEDLFVETSDHPSDPREQRLEDEANRFAARTLIPPPHDKRLATLGLNDVPAFAQILDVAPAIVVGRMQHDGIVPFNRGNNYRRRLTYAK
jgi:hypothetical protein